MGNGEWGIEHGEMGNKNDMYFSPSTGGGRGEASSSSSIISVVMAAYNAEEYIAEAIESVLNQSFADFEFIIVDDGSTDNTRTTIGAYNDKRIRLIDNKQNHAQSLNTGLQASNGKYIARMDADDIMHIDRLKIQCSLMEDFPDVTVCACWETVCGGKTAVRIADKQKSGIIDNALMSLLLDDMPTGTAYLIRRSFLTEHNLWFEDFAFAEDYKLRVELARHGGVFYMESQPLAYKRISDSTISRKRRYEQLLSKSKIKRDILFSLCSQHEASQALVPFCNACFELADRRLISESDMTKQIYALLTKNKNH